MQCGVCLACLLAAAWALVPRVMLPSCFLQAADSPALNKDASPHSEEQHREELIAACEEALGRRLPPAAEEAALPAAEQPVPAAADAAGTCALPLIVFNLFALEGFHLAEALGLPCLAASPCLVPYAPPAGFERRFQLQHPRLYQRLLAAGEGEGAPRNDALVGCKRGTGLWQQQQQLPWAI